MKQTDIDNTEIIPSTGHEEEEDVQIEQPGEDVAGGHTDPEAEPSADEADDNNTADSMPSLKQVIRETATEDEHPDSRQFTLRQILGGDILNTRQVRSQVKLILLITVFLIIYVSNRYSCQKALIQVARLEQQLQSVQKKTLSMSSELTEMTRETNVLSILKANNDTTLKAIEQPPYQIKVE